ncbi:hypothetical protein RIR_e42833_A0A2N1NVL1_9GLOM [Rhizophagus irregularis DAOM 181602=DAOM 197198]|nr:hypothetical protein RIR_e42833_A0A2N1NVL1_9GLOM [Rhizophagus irregularis DAOM 181602=DAOM 197198]
MRIYFDINHINLFHNIINPQKWHCGVYERFFFSCVLYVYVGFFSTFRCDIEMRTVV